MLRDNFGEFTFVDFKEQWPALTQLSRHVLGLANSGGGCIVVGVAEKEDRTLESAGIDVLMDKADVIKGIKRFMPNGLLEELDILNFSFEASEYAALIGKRFQVVFVTGDPKHLPFVAMSDGDGIQSNVVYVRRGPATEPANHDELQGVINRRLETGYSSHAEMDLRTHIEQLKFLHTQVPRYNTYIKGGIADAIAHFTEGAAAALLAGGKTERVINPWYPQEEFEEFISRMIATKKKTIEVLLNVSSM